jgi:hypothetical protein
MCCLETDNGYSAIFGESGDRDHKITLEIRSINYWQACFFNPQLPLSETNWYLDGVIDVWVFPNQLRLMKK